MRIGGEIGAQKPCVTEHHARQGGDDTADDADDREQECKYGKRAAKKEIKTVTVEEGGKKVEKNVNKRQLDQMRLEYARKLDAEKYANDRTVPLTDEQRAEMEAQKAQKGKKKK